MNRIFACYLLFSVAMLAASDFQTGVEAFDRGDYLAALRAWQPAADSGDANAQYNLGMLYANGQGVPTDYAKALEWYGKAAEQGVAAAQYNLGILYFSGLGVPQDARKAADWLGKAAEQGIHEAEVMLGELYQGDGPLRNYAEAEKWYRKADEHGMAAGAFRLGMMYDLGQGVTKDYAQAVQWYTKAANAGYAPAMTNLGILYYNAQGVNRDLVQAYAWFERGQKMGDKRAEELFRTTAKRMRPKDVKQGDALVAQWHAPATKPPVLETANLFKKPETAPAAASAQPISSAQQNPQAVWTGIERVIAVGDIHGDYEQAINVLKSAGLIDAKANWIGGNAHLVQTGDMVDRGPDARAVLDLFMKLEQQAHAAGGAVHVLIGNHEAMDAMGDLRFVAPGELSRGPSSYQTNRQQLLAEAKPDRSHSAAAPAELPEFKEYRAEFGPDGKYGRWIRSHNAVIKIDRTLFVHAGLSAKYAGMTIDDINRQVHEALNNPAAGPDVLNDEDGPLWYRGLAQGNEGGQQALVDQILKRFDVDRIVIGHTFTDAAVTPRFGGKVILIDVGLSRIYDNLGRLACLEIDRGHAYALHRGQGLELPKDEDGPDMLRYLRQAAQLDPNPSPLAERIRKLESGERQALTAASSAP